MNRREAINRVAWILGGTVVGAQFFLEGCTRPASKEVSSLFQEDRIDFLGDIAETILPKTSTPGAKEAGVGAFIPVMVRDCYTSENQRVFMEGLIKLEEASDQQFGKKFQELNPDDRTQLLSQLDQEAKQYRDQKQEGDPEHYFALIKQLTLLGFFSSELGATKALRYVKIPGRYDGDIPYKKGDKAWAT